MRKPREDKNDLINEAIQNLDVIKTALEELTKGGHESRVCEKYGVNRGFLRRLVFEPDRYFSQKQRKAPTKEMDDKHFLIGGEKLYSALMGTYPDVPYDVHKTMEYCIKNSNLKKQQISVLRMRFYENKTLEETGDILHLTKERVRQIESKALFLIKKHNRKILEYGTNAVLKCKKESLENALMEKEILIRHLQSLSEELQKKEEKIKQLSGAISEKEDVILHQSLREYIRYKDVSVRLYNLITREKLEDEPLSSWTLRRLNGYSIRKIKGIKGMGTTSLTELEFLLSKGGVQFAK